MIRAFSVYEVADAVEPHLAVEVGRLDDERVAVPPAARNSHPELRRLTRARAIVERNATVVVPPVQHLDHVARRLDQLEAPLRVARDALQAERLRVHVQPLARLARPAPREARAVLCRAPPAPTAGTGCGRQPGPTRSSPTAGVVTSTVLGLFDDRRRSSSRPSVPAGSAARQAVRGGRERRQLRAFCASHVRRAGPFRRVALGNSPDPQGRPAGPGRRNCDHHQPRQETVSHSHLSLVGVGSRWLVRLATATMLPPTTYLCGQFSSIK